MMPPPTFTLGFLPPPEDAAKYRLPLAKAYVEGVATLDVGIVSSHRSLPVSLSNARTTGCCRRTGCGDEKDAAFRDDSHTPFSFTRGGVVQLRIITELESSRHIDPC